MKNVEVYTYKENYYLKLDEIQVKNPVSREWDVYVLYKNADGHLFARETGEFHERFKVYFSGREHYWQRAFIADTFKFTDLERKLNQVD